MSLRNLQHGAVLALAIVTIVTGMPAFSQSNAVIIPFQGRLSEPGGDPVPDGTYDMTFAIYDVATDGTALWSTPTANVPVADGVFSMSFGGFVSFPAGLFRDNENLFFEVTADLDQDGLDGDDIQSPRTPINAAPLRHARAVRDQRGHDPFFRALYEDRD